MDELKKDVAVIKNDIGHIREDIKDLKTDVKDMNTVRLPSIQADLAVIDKSINDILNWFKPLVITVVGGVVVGVILYLLGLILQ